MLGQGYIIGHLGRALFLGRARYHKYYRYYAWAGGYIIGQGNIIGQPRARERKEGALPLRPSIGEPPSTPPPFSSHPNIINIFNNIHIILYIIYYILRPSIGKTLPTQFTSSL